jgi:allophanate hydrolase subunit 1
MEHKIIPATWKTKEALLEQIRNHEADGWSVAALGDVFGSSLLVLTRGAHKYEHDVIPVMLKTREKVEEIIQEKAAENWQVAAIGEHFGGVLMILKRLVKED